MSFVLDAPATEEQIEMILTYVPESEYIDFSVAWFLARERDWEASELALWAIQEVEDAQ